KRNRCGERLDDGRRPVAARVIDDDDLEAREPARLAGELAEKRPDRAFLVVARHDHRKTRHLDVSTGPLAISRPSERVRGAARQARSVPAQATNTTRRVAGRRPGQRAALSADARDRGWQR